MYVLPFSFSSCRLSGKKDLHVGLTFTNHVMVSIVQYLCENLIRIKEE